MEQLTQKPEKVSQDAIDYGAEVFCDDEQMQDVAKLAIELYDEYSCQDSETEYGEYDYNNDEQDDHDEDYNDNYDNNYDNSEYYDDHEDEYEKDFYESYEEMPVEKAVFDELNLPSLPKGYAFSGGAARAVFQRQILKEKDVYIRDIDIVSVQELEPDLRLAEWISEKYMPDDYAHGHGVHQESLKTYFSNRDLTINQVLVSNDKIYITQKAIMALRDKIVDLTDYEKAGDSWGSISEKLATKAVLMEQTFRAKYGKGSLADKETTCVWIENPFYVALQLDKALQFGNRLARNYIKALVNYGMIDERFAEEDMDWAKEELSSACYTPFEFKNGNISLDDLELDLLDSAEQSLENQIWAEANFRDDLYYGRLKSRDRIDHKSGRKFRGDVEI